MRPHKLIMKAFGPFAKETVVDFDSMGDNVYLISGDTGAGKTTIFDGIIYALYGTASGAARSNLGTEAFHSDYAKDGNRRDEMRVTLEFSNAGRTFTVSRRMYWGKKGDSKTVSKESTLSENGNTLVHSKGREDKDDVTAKVTEILGLDADQFRRIIMLAQGEFQKFLTAKSDERGRILGKLYDNRRHLDFQMRLKAANALLTDTDKNLVTAATAQINTLEIPDYIGKDIRDTISVDHPGLLPAIKQIIQRIDNDLSALEESIEKKQEKEEALKAQKVKGETQNGLLNELKGKKNELEELDRKREQYSALRKLVELAVAAERVLPSENAMLQADSELNETLLKIQELEDERKQLTIKFNTSKKSLDEVKAKNEPEIKKLEGQKAALNGILHYYDELAKSTDIYDQKYTEHAEAYANVTAAHTNLLQLQARQKELGDTLSRLASAGDAEVENENRALEDVKKRRDKLYEIRNEISRVKTLISEEDDLRRELATAQKNEKIAENEHHRLYNAFIQGQAGILAEDLREQLKTSPEVTCPVCGAIHTLADVSSFAYIHEDVPTRNAVDEAYSRLDNAHKNRTKAEKKHSEKDTKLQLNRKALLTKSDELLSVSDWTELTSGMKLTEAINECETQLSVAQARYNKAVSDKKEKVNATSEKAVTDQNVNLADQTLKEATELESRLRSEEASAKTSMENWKAQLKDYPENKEAAQNLIEAKTSLINTLQKEIEDANNEYSQCISSQAINKGNLENAYLDKERRIQAENSSKEAFNNQIKKNSFADEKAYHAALSPEGSLMNQDAISTWIGRKKAELDFYDNNRKELENRISQLNDSTKGMEYTDISEIQSQIQDVTKELSDLNNNSRTLTIRKDKNQGVYDNLRNIQKERTKLRRVFKKLSPLAETADGKYAFSRYVLTGFFHRIVEQANIHLEIMTDAEYCLIPKETGDGRSNIGLDLKVLNTLTSLERDTASLSGGQMFEASLSLALGLSDIVQMESASSIQIESMFIDEGFGSLDGVRLDKSIEVLRHLSADRRQIGIISHVARLDECLTRKIHVIAGDRGSSVRIETDA